MDVLQENNGDKNLLRNDLGDNRGTKIKREIPRPLGVNELRDFSVLEAGREPAQPQWPKDCKSFVSTIPPFEHIRVGGGVCSCKVRCKFANFQ